MEKPLAPPAPHAPTTSTAHSPSAQDAGNLAAFHAASSPDSAWIRGMILATAETAGVPNALLLERHSIARLARIASILEQVEADARLTDLELLGRALSRTVAHEVIDQLRQEAR
jgi:hypothetical protein